MLRDGTQLMHAFVEREGDGWVAEAYLLDSVKGHVPTVERSTHTTQEAAIEHLHVLGEQYPNSKDVTIIVDDMAG